MADEYDIVAEEAPGKGCSAVLARKSTNLRALDRSQLPEAERRWLEYLAEFVATAWVDIAGQPVSVASVHALAGEVKSPLVTDVDHEAVRRRTLKRAWHNDLAAAALVPLADSGFLFGGDWNSANLFDSVYPKTAPASVEFFTNRTAAGWHHALRKFSDAEVRTYLDPSSGPYELDHLFTDPELHTRLVRSEVLAQQPVPDLSDHAVVVAEFTLP